jgi:hypothetical protein
MNTAKQIRIWQTDLDLEKQTSLFLKQTKKKEWAQQKLVEYIQTLKDRKDRDRIEASTVRSYFKGSLRVT